MQNTEKANYRILTVNGKYLNAGTDEPSWFNLDKARKLVDDAKEQVIVEICEATGRILWEVL